MTDKAAILALAERCEAATVPDSWLDREIAVASGQFIRLSRDRDGMLASVGRPNEFSYYKPDYTASIDAALTLMPEGFVKREIRFFAAGGCKVSMFDKHSLGQVGKAATEALAICAAALRARAAQLTSRPAGRSPEATKSASGGSGS